jgi:excisionase family DNA binding protein
VKLLTAQQVADQLQVPATFVYRLAREGKIPCVQIGRYRRFTDQAIEEWIASQTRAPINGRGAR